MYNTYEYEPKEGTNSSGRQKRGRHVGSKNRLTSIKKQKINNKFDNQSERLPKSSSNLHHQWEICYRYSVIAKFQKVLLMSVLLCLTCQFLSKNLNQNLKMYQRILDMIVQYVPENLIYFSCFSPKGGEKMCSGLFLHFFPLLDIF